MCIRDRREQNTRHASLVVHESPRSTQLYPFKVKLCCSLQHRVFFSMPQGEGNGNETSTAPMVIKTVRVGGNAKFQLRMATDLRIATESLLFRVKANWKKLLLRALRLMPLPARRRRDREPNCDASRLWLAITSKLLDVGVLASQRGMTTGTEELR